MIRDTILFITGFFSNDIQFILVDTLCPKKFPAKMFLSFDNHGYYRINTDKCTTKISREMFCCCLC